jgi:hypothetical protein
MDTHKNVPLTPRGREMMVQTVVDFGLSNAAAARQFNTTRKTVTKWIERSEAGSVEGLRDRSSRPLSSPSQATPAICATVEALRRRRHTGKQIAAEVGVSRLRLEPPQAARFGLSQPLLGQISHERYAALDLGKQPSQIRLLDADAPYQLRPTSRSQEVYLRLALSLNDVTCAGS